MLSVVIPCFNEEEGIQECYRRLVAVLDTLPEPFELVFVNDGSRDSTYPQLLAIQQFDPRVVLVELSRNFGHQKAVSAGLDTSLGDGVVIIDADLQDPPEIILKMYEIWKQGVEVVYGVREIRTGESVFKLWTAKIFYQLINRLADVDIPMDTGDFRLIDRRVVNVMVQMPERHRLLRAMCSWVGFKQVGRPLSTCGALCGNHKVSTEEYGEPRVRRHPVILHVAVAHPDGRGRDYGGAVAPGKSLCDICAAVYTSLGTRLGDAVYCSTVSERLQIVLDRRHRRVHRTRLYRS